jgi:hypothetical protein
MKTTRQDQTEAADWLGAEEGIDPTPPVEANGLAAGSGCRGPPVLTVQQRRNRNN